MTEYEIDPNPIIGKIRERGFTQKKFADSVGLSAVGLRGKLQGKYDIRWNELMKWAEVLGVEVGSPEFYRVFFSKKNY